MSSSSNWRERSSVRNSVHSSKKPLKKNLKDINYWKESSYICTWKNNDWVIIKKEKPLLDKKYLLYNDNPNFRRIMCKKWKKNGKCPYGIKCQFAHGKEEIGTKLDEYEFYWRLIQIEVFSGKK